MNTTTHQAINQLITEMELDSATRTSAEQFGDWYQSMIDHKLNEESTNETTTSNSNNNSEPAS